MVDLIDYKCPVCNRMDKVPYDLNCNCPLCGQNFKTMKDNKEECKRIEEEAIRVKEFETWIKSNKDSIEMVFVDTYKKKQREYIKTNHYYDTNIRLPDLEMIFIRGGKYVSMGDTWGDGDKDEEPVHEVILDNFMIGKFQITQTQWLTLMGTNPSKFKKNNLNAPVENVTWNDAQAFIEKLTEYSQLQFRLPTETEWEYAARGRSKIQKYAGNKTIQDSIWFKDNSNNKTHPVGKKDANIFGIYDMSGNVCEWVNDWYAPYSIESQNNPTGPSTGQSKILRGGSWNLDYWFARVCARMSAPPETLSNEIGFRIAISLETK